MCGIIGVLSTNSKNLAPLLIDSLSRLEYRGYDSAGIAIPNNGKSEILKCLGAPSENLKEPDFNHGQTVLSTIGIGHNRWATHGKPSIDNAHPHTDSYNKIAVVHNGTILNYENLKQELQSEGVIFKSETDTEVIPHLIAKYRVQGANMEDAFASTINHLEGAFGILAFDSSEPNKLYTAKQGSPIVIGITDDAYYVASSIHAFAPYANRFIPLNDGEVAVLSSQPKLEILLQKIGTNTPLANREQQPTNLDDPTALSKGEFETFMLKEIFEQPATTIATMLGRTNPKNGTAVLGGLFDHKELLNKAEHMLLVGCGTAYNAAEIGAYVIEKLTDMSVRTEISSEGLYKKLNLDPDKTIAFAISQSGETADTIEYIKELNRKHYPTFGIVNVVGSALAELTGKGIYTQAGHEIGVASTKAFTSQLAALYLIALYVGRMKYMDTETGMKFVANIEAIPNLMKKTLADSDHIKELVQQLQQFKKIQFLGRGVHVSVAKEAALKFKEITYLETGAYPLGELKHGPIAIVDEQTLSVVILPKDELFELGINSIEQIKSKGGNILLITNESVRGHSVCKKADQVVFIPDLEDPLFYPFLEIIPLQLFAYYFAKVLGRNIDKPRNLAKSVTVQ